MNPDAHLLWRGPRWLLSVLLALLGMLGPFSIDTYIPAFTGIAQTIGATPIEMQQTLSGYLFGFAVMNLFHGSLSDSFGRRPVVLWGLAVFTAASLGCAVSQTIGHLVFFRVVQGLSAGAGVVVSRAVIRDMFPHADAQRVMSQVTILLRRGAGDRADRRRAALRAPRLALDLLVPGGRRRGAVGRQLPLSAGDLAPRSAPAVQHAPPARRLLAARLEPAFPDAGAGQRRAFNGMFLYVLSAPVFLGAHLQLGPTQFFWFFLCTIGGIMGGALFSGRLAGKIKPHHQIRHGFLIMLVVSVLNLVYSALLPVTAPWALIPIGIYAFGWALMVPVVTLLVLDLVPERRGMASSLQACIGSVANALVAGLIAPLVMHSTLLLAIAALLMMSVGLFAWIWVKPRLGLGRLKLK